MIPLFLAWKDLKKDKKIVLLVVFLLAFSFVNLTFFASFIAGLANTFQEDIINTQTGHILLEPSDERDIYIQDYDNARKKLSLVPGVIGVAGHISVPAAIVSEYNQISAPLVAIDPSDELQVTNIEEQILIGDYLGEKDTTNIILGKDLAGTERMNLPGYTAQQFGIEEKGLNVRVGEKVKVTFQNGEQRDLTVRAIAGRDGPGVVSRQAYITHKLAEEAAGLEDVATQILIRLPSKELAEDYKPLVLEQGVIGAKVKTWEESSGFAEALGRTFNIVIYITSVIGVLIAILTVSIVIFINISRKRRSIAVLKAIGTPDTVILKTYLFESIMFGVMGIILGIVLSKLVTAYFTVNPIHLPFGFLTPELKTAYILWASVAIMASSLGAGYLPAHLASKQKILEHIRVT